MEDKLQMDKEINSIDNNSSNLKSENFLSQKKLNSINEFELNDLEFSSNLIGNNNNYNLNNKNKKKCWFFIAVIIILLLLIIISIICLYLKKNEDKEEDKEEDINKYSFELVYYSDKNNEKISLIHNSLVDIIGKMEINKEIIKPCSEYIFKEKGSHTVYFYIKKN